MPKMRELRPMARAALAALGLRASLQAIGGCGNHGCRLEEPKGMAPNGPCRCVTDRDKIATVFAAVREFCKTYDG